MRHYCDASVLVKAFIAEAGSSHIKALLLEPEEWLVSRFGLVEIAAGLCRAGR